MQRGLLGWFGLIGWLVLLSGCTASNQRRDGSAGRSEIKEFEYSYYGGGKTTLSGKITKESFHIQCASSYPTDYDVKGNTPAGAWALVRWLYEFGETPRSDQHGAFGATFTFIGGPVETRSFDVDKCHLILFQIEEDCRGSTVSDETTPSAPTPPMGF